MSKLIGLFVIAMILSVGVATLSYAAADTAAPGTQTIQGDLLNIEGEFYVVKDTTGKDVRVHVDNTSKLEGSFKVGDKVEAQVTEQGHALSITKPLVADAQTGPQTVQGDVLKMDGDVYIVKDMTGKEIRLHVDKTTDLQGAVKAGDKIEAQVTEQGHALSMKRVQIEPAKPAKK